MKKPLILMGASVRAAAESAVRAGYAPWCVDQFGDRDLRRIAACCGVVTRWTGDVVKILDDAPDAPWMFTGALENHPSLVARLAGRRMLAGNNAESIQRVRDPFAVARILRNAGKPTLRVSDTPSAIPGVTWLRKPFAGSAGMGIRFARPGDKASSRFFCQEFREGTPVSGLYVTNGEATQLVGLARQLTRRSGSAEGRFLHAGTVGPLSLEDVPASAFEQANFIGCEIAGFGELRGLFGCDFILESDSSTLWLTEVNPRYSASAEVHEREPRPSLVHAHLEACEGREPGEWNRSVESTWPYQGRLVVWADERNSNEPLIVGDLEEFAERHLPAGTGMSDIPIAGTTIVPGQPICTLRSSGSSVGECVERLNEAAVELKSIFR